MTTRTKGIFFIAACLIGGMITLLVSIPRAGIDNPLFTWASESPHEFPDTPCINGLQYKNPVRFETIHDLIHAAPLPNQAVFTEWAVESLKNNTGETIDLKSTQAPLVSLRMFLAEHYPDEWRLLFSHIIQGAFRENAPAIFDFLARMDRYTKWFEENKHHLATLNYPEIKGIIQARQDDLFGKYSKKIKTCIAGDVLCILNDSYDTSIDKKLSLFIQMIHDNDGCEMDPIRDKSKFYLSRAFFRMNSVQENLKTLSAIERKQTIRSVRQALGYSQEVIEKLAQVDAKRNERWKKGCQYMKERTSLMVSYLGDELEQRLYELQERTFGELTQIIRTEEASGFFRFQRPRIYGSN